MLSVVFGFCPSSFLDFGIFHPHGMIRPVRGLVFVHLYELKKFHPIGIIRPACGHYLYPSIFMDLRNFFHLG